MTDSIRQTENWFKAALPEPTSKDFDTQLGVFIEEFIEAMQQITLIPNQANNAKDINKVDFWFSNVLNTLQNVSNNLKLGEYSATIKDRVLLLDGLTDVVVTAQATAYTAHMNLPDALDEVNRANYSKFVDGKPIFVEGTKKVAKGPSYEAPDLTTFV